ncbi:MAG: hypothetical protein IJX64_00455 [Clostridia bacterium]|nr:hypothetical protein [Clostridia bacterium]
MEYLYHGSGIKGITKLYANAKLHDTNQDVIYLTNNIPYSLFYIWDETHIGFRGKHITAWIKNGITYYEEQFPEQLKTFYKGAAGYLYCIAKHSECFPVKEREGMFFSSVDTEVEKAIYIPDVYEELMRYEMIGKLKVLRYNDQTKQRQNELTDIIAASIIKRDFYKNNPPRAMFMKKYFQKAWKKAEQQYY